MRFSGVMGRKSDAQCGWRCFYETVAATRPRANKTWRENATHSDVNGSARHEAIDDQKTQSTIWLN
jgi:hypothetical protein